jgi:polar amino acid transport system ATP-binding protein
MLEVRGLWKSYGHHPVLRGIDLDVATGSVLCVIGPSGSGKSTLLYCVNHLEPFDRGRLRVGGELVGYREHKGRLHELPEREVARMRQSVGMVFQQFNLFPHMTALQNIVEAPIRVKRVRPDAARKRAFELLDRVGLVDRHGAYPAQLSGGQQQRVASARALAMDPKLPARSATRSRSWTRG